MAELNGSLEGIGLLALVRFLTGVARNGRLVIRDADLAGRLDFENGLLVGAAFDQEEGMAALEAIALALANGRFDFREADVPMQHNLELTLDEVTDTLERLGREQAVLHAAVPSLGAVPHVVLDEGSDDRQVSLERDTLRLLVRLDGRRTVAELAHERGLLRTLRQLADLARLTLVRVETGPTSTTRYEPVVTRPEPDRPAAEESTEAATSAPRGRGGTTEPAWSRWRRPTDHG